MVFNKEFVMLLDRFDTFEDEKEITTLIKKLQEQCVEAMQRPDTWEFNCSEERKEIKK